MVARTKLEDAMTEAMVRACVSCKKRFFKDEGCNKMQCECGQSMCYLCRRPVENDYTHFYAQGASPVKGKCPLWSDNINLHKAEVMKATEEAKKAVDGKKLKYDPTKNLEKPPEGFDPKALHNNFGGNGEYMEGEDDDSDDDSDGGSFPSWCLSCKLRSLTAPPLKQSLSSSILEMGLERRKKVLAESRASGLTGRRCRSSRPCSPGTRCGGADYLQVLIMWCDYCTVCTA